MAYQIIKKTKMKINKNWNMKSETSSSPISAPPSVDTDTKHFSFTFSSRIFVSVFLSANIWLFVLHDVHNRGSVSSWNTKQNNNSQTLTQGTFARNSIRWKRKTKTFYFFLLTKKNASTTQINYYFIAATEKFVNENMTHSVYTVINLSMT